jgi:uncharacterized protein with GYD domain
MAVFISQARFTKDCLTEFIAATEDRVNHFSRLFAQVGGELINFYLTSGDYDILFIFVSSSYGNAVPALIAASAESGITDLKTVTALARDETKRAFDRARAIEPNHRSTERPALISL